MKSVFTKEYSKLVAALIDARKDADLTQQELAQKLHKPQSFVSKYERKERRLDVVELVSISLALGLDSCQIIREIEARLRSELDQGAVS